MGALRASCVALGLAGALLVVGCGGGNGNGDGGPDGGDRDTGGRDTGRDTTPEDMGGGDEGGKDMGGSPFEKNFVPCSDPSKAPTTFGPAFMVSDFTWTEEPGFDFTGDGTPDQQLNDILVGSAVGKKANGLIDLAIRTDQFGLVAEFQGLTEPLTAPINGNVTVNFYRARRVPDDPGHYEIDPRSLDASCQPTFTMTGTVTDGVIELTVEDGAKLRGLAFFYGLEFSHARLQAVFEDDGKGGFRIGGDIECSPDRMGASCGLFGGVMPACYLSRDVMVEEGGSILSTAIDIFGADVVTPDVDEPGTLEGLTAFEIESVEAISRCSVGDAESTDPLCGCDPRFNDGFSTALRFSAVPAVIDGVQFN